MAQAMMIGQGIPAEAKNQELITYIWMSGWMNGTKVVSDLCEESLG